MEKSFFTTPRRVLEKSFLNQFIGVIFEARNETQEKVWSDSGAEKKVKTGAKRE